MTGAVVELLGRRVRVRPEGCACAEGPLACSGCGAAHAGLIIAENRQGLPLAPGRRVEIRSPFPMLLGEALGSFLPPLLGAAALYGLGGLLGWGEAPRIGAAFLGLAAAFFIVFTVRRRFPSRALPQIRRILQS